MHKFSNRDFDKTKTYRSWCFTLNNPTEQLTWDEKKVRYAIWQEEKAPTTGTIHYQGFMQLRRGQRFSYVKKILPTAHWEPRHKHSTNEAAIVYCEKNETKIAGPWTFGKIVRKGQRTDLEECKAKLDEGASLKTVAMEHFETWTRCRGAFREYREMVQPKRTWKTEVIVRWGTTGTGKTSGVYEAEPDVHPVEYENHFWSAYDGQEVVLWDDFEPGMISRGLFLRLTDRYPCKLRILHGWAEWLPRKLYITSNFDPATWYGGDPAVQRRLDEIIHIE